MTNHSKITAKIPAREEKLAAKYRRKAILWRRFCFNVRQPSRLILLLLLLLGEIWLITKGPILFPGEFSNPLLLILWYIGTKLVIILIALLLALAILTAAPPQALKYEAAFTCMHKKFVDGNGNPPVLIARRRFKESRKEEIIFYSAGISLESWSERRSDIQDALNVTYVKAPQYAYKTRHCILLTVVPGVGSSPEETLYDDEL